jgi:hypothetical protein
MIAAIGISDAGGGGEGLARKPDRAGKQWKVLPSDEDSRHSALDGRTVACVSGGEPQYHVLRSISTAQQPARTKPPA